MKFYKVIDSPIYFGLLNSTNAIFVENNPKGSIISNNMEFTHDCDNDSTLVECTKEEFMQAYQEAYTNINILAIEMKKNNEFIKNESLKSEGY